MTKLPHSDHPVDDRKIHLAVRGLAVYLQRGEFEVFEVRAGLRAKGS